MPLDLTPIKNFVEGEMTDDITIARGGVEEVFNEWTGRYEPAEDTELYDGKGLVASINAYPNEEPEGQATASYVRYTLMVPLTCPPLLVNDFVILNNCVRDPQLNGTVYNVESVDRSSFQAVRSAQITFREVAGQVQ